MRFILEMNPALFPELHDHVVLAFDRESQILVDVGGKSYQVFSFSRDVSGFNKAGSLIEQVASQDIRAIQIESYDLETETRGLDLSEN